MDIVAGNVLLFNHTRETAHTIFEVVIFVRHGTAKTLIHVALLLKPKKAITIAGGCIIHDF